MSLLHPFFKLYKCFILIVFVIVTILSPSHAQTPELLLSIDDTTYQTNDGEKRMLRINMSNYEDTVAGFNLWLKIGSPDLIQFTTSDTTVIDTLYWQCINWDGVDCLDYMPVYPPSPYDSVSIDTLDVQDGNADTTGTLIAGWQYISSRSISGLGTDINLIGIANMYSPPYIPGIPPGNHSIPLIKAPFEVPNYPPYGDTFYAHIVLNHYPGEFGFSDPNGDLIGLAYDTIIDTSYYTCTQWIGEDCYNWQQVPLPPYDSIYIDSNIVPYIDTNLIVVIIDSFLILPECVPIFPGDVDGSGDYDSADRTILIDYIYLGEPPLPLPYNGDVDGNCVINYDDVMRLLFDGPFVPCTCPEPQRDCCRGLTGNSNNDIDDEVLVDDLTFLVDYLFKGGPEPICIEEALINPYTDNTIPLVSDLTHLVDYLFKGGELPDVCPGN